MEGCRVIEKVAITADQNISLAIDSCFDYYVVVGISAYTSMPVISTMSA
jgi:hypothetical protein